MSLNDEDRLRLLSDAERAAMEDDSEEYDPDADNAAALAELGRGALDAEDGEEDDADSGSANKHTDTTDPTAPTDAPAATGADAAAAAGDPTDPTDPTPPVDTPAPAAQATRQAAGYRVDLPADYDDQVKANKDAVSSARTKFNDGEIDQAELDTQLEQLQDQRDQLRDLQTRAKISAEMREQSEKDAWVSTINSFVEDAAKTAEMGIVDYRNDPAKQADLDAMVRALAATAGNENKPMRWFLEEGHKRVVALHGIAAVPTTKKPVDTRRKPDPSAVVTSLADVPGGAGDADPVNDEFTDLDKLTGLDYERALGRLSDDKRAQYLRSI